MSSDQPMPAGVPYPRYWPVDGSAPQSPPLGLNYPDLAEPQQWTEPVPVAVVDPFAGSAGGPDAYAAFRAAPPESPVPPDYPAPVDRGFDPRFDRALDEGVEADGGWNEDSRWSEDGGWGGDGWRQNGWDQSDDWGQSDLVDDRIDDRIDRFPAREAADRRRRSGGDRAPKFTKYKLQVRSLRVIWATVFFGAVFLPLVLVPRAGGIQRPWSAGGLAIELCLTTGLLALSTLAATVILPSRMRSISKAFGVEGMLHSHKLLALVTTGLVLAHIGFVVLDNPSNVALLWPVTGPPRARAGEAAAVALILTCWLALRRRKLGTRYELWRMLHALLGVVIIVGTYLHIYFLNHLMQDVAERSLFMAILLFIIGVFANRWIVRPIRARRKAYVIKSVHGESASTSTLTLTPARRRQPGLKYRPGQFAWIRMDSPFGPLQGHPFTIASAPHNKRELQFTIRNAGDFTGAISVLTLGRKVFVDGPYGDFNDDHLNCKSLLLIAGGIGITPMMSILRSHAHRRDRRPHVLVSCARSEDDLMFRDELDHLKKIMNLTVVEVLSSPPPGWTGVSGRLDAEVLSKILEQRALRKPDVFICGPSKMMVGTRAALAECGVEDKRIHTEDFAMV